MDRLKSLGVAFGAVCIMCIAIGLVSVLMMEFPGIFVAVFVTLLICLFGWAVFDADFEVRTKNTRAQVEEKRAQNNTLDSGIEKTRGE